MYGVIPGLAICNVESDTRLSTRIAARNMPSVGLEPAFDPRPVSTKYTQLSIVDSYPCATVKPATYQSYNVGDVFYPGTAKAPWQGFADKVNTESTLRNQFFALQDCQQSAYVPSTHSSMYDQSAVLDTAAKAPTPQCGNLFERSTRHDRLRKCEKH